MTPSKSRPEKTIQIGVVGCGQWGPNHIRNFSQFSSSQVAVCVDLSDARLQAMKRLYPSIRVTKDVGSIFRQQVLNALVIATPSSTHYQLVKKALISGMDVLCEKPLCLSVRQAEELVGIARKYHRILMVGHVFNFNAGIRKLREMISKKACGKLYYMHSERTNLGPFRTDVNAVWDLACHDVYIFNYLLQQQPIEVAAHGGRYLQKKIEDVAFVSLRYPSNILVNIHVSWLDPRKVRQITVVGDKKMVIWDDLDNVGPIKVYDRRVVPNYFYTTFGEFSLLAKEGNITIPKIDLYEPLKAQDLHFLECVQSRKQPLTDGMAGVETIRVLAAIQKSLAKNGVSVSVS